MFPICPARRSPNRSLELDLLFVVIFRDKRLSIQHCKGVLQCYVGVFLDFNSSIMSRSLMAGPSFRPM